MKNSVKKILLASVLSMVSTVSYAKSINMTEKGNLLVVKDDCYCFPTKVIGMSDTSEQSISRGIKDGAAVQSIVMDGSIRAAKVDQPALVAEMDDYVKSVGLYFKDRPQHKGLLMVQFVLFPGYKKPFQVDISQLKSPDEITKMTEFNKTMKETSACNTEGYCASLGAMKIKFSNSPSELNEEEFVEFVHSQPASGVEVYAKNKMYNKPISFIMVIGTNGYLATPEKIKEELGQ